jgi:hypothetical protein
MDGYRVCAKVSLYFPEPVPGADADANVLLYARAFATVLESELSNGRLPFDEGTLHQRITSLVKLVPRHRVRLTELHLATGPSGQQLQQSAPASIRASSPSLKPPVRTTPPVRKESGFVTSEARSRQATSGFALTLERSVHHMLPAEVGSVLAGPVRDAAAQLLVTAVDVLRERVADPLSLFDGTGDREQQRALVTEVCACVCYLLLDALLNEGIPQPVAVSVTQGASAHAVLGRPVPGSEISRYLALANPAFELAVRLSGLLGGGESPDLQHRLGFVLHAIRADARLCAERLRARAVRSV